MAKDTLLELTQEVMLAIDSDIVNSISDTTEATQVAKLIRRTFKALMDEKNWPHQKSAFVLVGQTDVLQPTNLLMPEGVKELTVLNYNKRKATDTRDKYSKVNYIDPEEFLRKQNALDSSDSKVVTVTLDSGVKTYVRNDNAPTVWTAFDDDLIIMNSFDSAVDTTLQQSKTQCWGYKNSVALLLNDTAIPDMPEEMFSLLLYESISLAAVEVRQADHPKAEQNSRRQRDQQSAKSWRTNSDFKLPNFGFRRSGR